MRRACAAGISSVLIAELLAACSHAPGVARSSTSSTTIGRSPSATVVVRAVETLGWIKPSRDADTWLGGIRGAVTSRLGNATVVLSRLVGRSTGMATTDRHGTVRFQVTPGRYHLRLAGQECDAGAVGQTIVIPTHHVIHVQVTCEQP